ncbi:sensor histidine kinase [Bacillus sp. 2205SS5-2]|uniref:sensor histidine kinase n=1 Tax=Bacillus sp. 2205SS5-2 TaxID=3109031 RepID=UPI003007319B
MRTENLFIWILKQYLFLALFGTVVFFVFLQLFLYLAQDPMVSLVESLWLTVCLFLVLLTVNIIVGFRFGTSLKHSFQDVLTFVSILRSGKFSERMNSEGGGQFPILTEELNELASYMQDQVKSLQRLADEKSQLLDKAHQAAVIEERQRLARDLHDSVSQQLFALNMLSAAACKAVEKKSEHAETQIKQVAEIASKAQGEMRALLLHLRPIDLRGETLEQGIQKLVSELRGRTPINFVEKLVGLDGVSKGKEAHLFRIVQEALSNILRHANATEIQILSEKKENHLLLYISDNGKGFSVNQHKMTSYGVQSMKERCEELGGLFQLRSKENEGTYIKMKIPFDEESK